MLEGLKPLQARLNAVGDTKGLTRQLGLETVAGAKLRVRRKTGTTARTIRLSRVTETEAVVTVGAAGTYLERGTRPHIIRARPGKVLMWPAKGVKTTLGGRASRTNINRKTGKFKAGTFIVARMVRHPGTKAQPFLIPSARAAIARLGVGRLVERWNRAA